MRREPIPVVIPSLSRWRNVKRAGKLFVDPIWCVAKSEVKEYRRAGAKNLLIHSDDIVGIGATRQFIMDSMDEDIVFMVDDDAYYVWCNLGRVGRRVDDPGAIQQIIDNAAYIAKDMGTCVFGFNTSYDVRKIKANDPVKLDSWVGSAIGIIGRDIHVNQGFGLRNDIPYCLRVLEKKRAIYRDDRFAFVCLMNKNMGGLQKFRTKDKDIEEQERVMKEWGRWVEYGLSETRTSVKLNVSRRQAMNTGALVF